MSARNGEITLSQLSDSRPMQRKPLAPQRNSETKTGTSRDSGREGSLTGGRGNLRRTTSRTGRLPDRRHRTQTGLGAIWPRLGLRVQDP